MTKHEHIEHANKILTHYSVGVTVALFLLAVAFVIFVFVPGLEEVKCSDLGSYGEAEFYYGLGAKHLDGDGNEIPCEALYNGGKGL